MTSRILTRPGRKYCPGQVKTIITSRTPTRPGWEYSNKFQVGNIVKSRTPARPGREYVPGSEYCNKQDPDQTKQGIL